MRQLDASTQIGRGHLNDSEDEDENEDEAGNEDADADGYELGAD